MKKINSGEVEFKLVGKGTYWEVRQKVYLFGLIPYWSKFYWGANELGRYATKSMALIGIAEYIAARDRVETLITILRTIFVTVFTSHNHLMETVDES